MDDDRQKTTWESMDEDARSSLIEELLLAIGIPMGWKDLDQVYVSVLSSISDFGLEEADLLAVSDRVGVPIGEHDYLVDIVKLMYETRRAASA